jgi:hypothetical protein
VSWIGADNLFHFRIWLPRGFQSDTESKRSVGGNADPIPTSCPGSVFAQQAVLFEFRTSDGDLSGTGHGIADCLYFSAITQLTIGYGDIAPLHGLRAIAVVQGVLGFFFTVILVARLISELPQISGDLERLP